MSIDFISSVRFIVHEMNETGIETRITSGNQVSYNFISIKMVLNFNFASYYVTAPSTLQSIYTFVGFRASFSAST